MDWDVEGKKALVTGASSGLGAALARALAAAGATVGIVARREDRLAEVLAHCREHSPGSQMWSVDLSDAAAVDRLAADAASALGGIDLLVNNAGVLHEAHVAEVTAEDAEAVMRLNYLAPVRLTAALLPGMLARGDGRVVNIASVASTLSSPGESAYDASKAALSVYSEAANIDLWGTGVQFLVVYPAIVDETELFSSDPALDPRKSGVGKVPVAEFVEAVMAALRDGRRQLYVPEWFADVAAAKAADVEAFIAGAAAYIAAPDDPSTGSPPHR